jgi:hypothetical protein
MFLSYNASAVNIYNATINRVRLESKNIFFYFEKRTSLLLQRWRCSCNFKSCRIGSWQQYCQFLNKILQLIHIQK